MNKLAVAIVAILVSMSLSAPASARYNAVANDEAKPAAAKASYSGKSYSKSGKAKSSKSTSGAKRGRPAGKASASRSK